MVLYTLNTHVVHNVKKRESDKKKEKCYHLSQLSSMMWNLEYTVQRSCRLQRPRNYTRNVEEWSHPMCINVLKIFYNHCILWICFVVRNGQKLYLTHKMPGYRWRWLLQSTSCSRIISEHILVIIFWNEIHRYQQVSTFLCFFFLVAIFKYKRMLVFRY